MALRRNYARYGASTTFFDSVEEFLSSPVPASSPEEAEAISIRYGAAFMDVLVEDRGADVTIVLFHAAIDRWLKALMRTWCISPIPRWIGAQVLGGSQGMSHAHFRRTLLPA